MKMYGYVSKKGSSLYVRKDKKLAKEYCNRLVRTLLGMSETAAEKYIKDHYNEVEIEYNEVT